MALQSTPIKIALDWTPNTIHSGLFIAKEAGIYESLGLAVDLLSPDPDYRKTPAKRLEAGEVDLAICPSESCIAYQQSGKMKLQAIYAILQRDASAIASTELRGIRELGDGKVYGSYNARYEEAIVRAMVKDDGGDGDGVIIERQHGKFNLFESLKAGKIDATWIFLPWEGVAAEHDGLELYEFVPADYGVPYGYSPVIAHNASSGRLDDDVLRNFVAATREGYNRAIRNVEEAVSVVRKHCDPPQSPSMLSWSQEMINEYYSDGSTLGRMSTQKWTNFANWLTKQGLLQANSIHIDQLFKNP